MNNILMYLASQPQIRKAVVCLGAKSSEWLVYDICVETAINHLFVYTPTDELRKKVQNAMQVLRAERTSDIPESFTLLAENELYSLKSLERSDDLALIFDDLCDDRLLNKMKYLSPVWLSGALRTTVDPFKIWEQWNRECDHLYITFKRNRDECMKWDRQLGNDTELSVIFPMYNIAQYLPQCVETVTEWNAPYIEFLFVDDGSPDNSAEIIQEYAKKDSRIKLLQKENGGCASARQYGLERAKGRYIGFIDPDDYVDPTMYRKLLARALSGSYDIAYCGYNEVYESNGQTREVPDNIGGVYADGTCNASLINDLICYLRIAIWRGIYSRDLLERSHIGFHTDLKRFDDLPFKVEVYSKARSVVSVPEYLYYYRLARPGQDVSADDERLYVHFAIFKYLDDFLRHSNDKSQIDYLQLVKVHTHRYALEKMRPEFVKAYTRQAKADIRSNFSFRDGLYVIRKKGNRMDVKYYIALYFGRVHAIRRLIRKNSGTQNVAPSNAVADKLKELAEQRL